MPDLALRQPECQRFAPAEWLAVDIETLTALRTPDGRDALTAAGAVAGSDPLVAATALRAGGIPAGLAAAALTQAALRRRAEAKFGPDAERMFFTRDGLEQATRAPVAARRAARLVAAGVRTLADLGCGVGADALAAARHGIAVTAVDADPLTAAVAAANAEALGLDVTVLCADATTVGVERYDGVFADPARRGGRGRVIRPPVVVAAVGLHRRAAGARAADGPQTRAGHRPRADCRRGPRASGCRPAATWSRPPSGVGRWRWCRAGPPCCPPDRS